MNNKSTRRTDYRSSLDDLDISGRSVWSIAHVTGWEPHELHDLAHASGVVSVLYTYTDPAQHLTTAAIGSTRSM